MRASYIERLIWRFFKRQVFGGFNVLLNRRVIPVTLFLLFVPIYEYLIGPTPSATITVSISLMAIGIILAHRPIGALESAVISSYVFFSWCLIAYYCPEIVISSFFLDKVILMIVFLWFVFNSTMFVMQMWDFFASTGGLYLLLGSDKDRIFLYPLPHAIYVIVAIYVSIKYLGLHSIYVYIGVAAPLVPIALIHTVTRNMGRIIRAALSIYIIVATYTAFVSLAGDKASSSYIFWTILCLLSMLFTIQKHARKAITRESNDKRPVFLVYLILGFTLMAIQLFISPPMKSTDMIKTWHILSLLAATVAPILALVTIHLSGKLDYYIERDNFTTIMLIKETMNILGKKVLKEIGKTRMRDILSMFLA